MSNDVISSMGSNNTTPAISFYSIIDIDMSLIKYIILHLRNENVFDLDKVKQMTYFDILEELYYRKYNNPLYFLMKNEKDKDFLDKCYEEFKSNEDEILSCAVITEMSNLIVEFKKSAEIRPSIFYYTEKQKELLESIEEFDDINIISIDDVISKKNSYGQFFFKSIDEIEPFKDLTYKTFYFSSCGLNLNNNNDDISIDINELKELIYNKNHISLFDMYIKDVFTRRNNE